jgi:DNA-binding protein HU-beta
MNRKELTAVLAKKTGMPKCDIDTVLAAMVSECQEQLARGESIKLQGLGTIEVRPRAPRKGRNIIDGSEVHVPARLVPAFKASKMLREIVDQS